MMFAQAMWKYEYYPLAQTMLAHQISTSHNADLLFEPMCCLGHTLRTIITDLPLHGLPARCETRVS